MKYFICCGSVSGPLSIIYLSVDCKITRSFHFSRHQHCKMAQPEQPVDVHHRDVDAALNPPQEQERAPVADLACCPSFAG